MKVLTPQTEALPCRPPIPFRFFEIFFHGICLVLNPRRQLILLRLNWFQSNSIFLQRKNIQMYSGLVVLIATVLCIQVTWQPPQQADPVWELFKSESYAFITMSGLAVVLVRTHLAAITAIPQRGSTVFAQKLTQRFLRGLLDSPLAP